MAGKRQYVERLPSMLVVSSPTCPATSHYLTYINLHHQLFSGGYKGRLPSTQSGKSDLQVSRFAMCQLVLGNLTNCKIVYVVAPLQNQKLWLRWSCTYHRVGGSISSSFCPHVDVSLGKTLNPKLALSCLGVLR